MAQRVDIVLVDDVDGSEATQTVSFAIDGTTFEIDLNDANAAALRDAVSEFVQHARKVGARPGRAPRRASSRAATGATPKNVRDWARAQGIDVTERGRVPASVREAYDAVH